MYTVLRRNTVFLLVCPCVYTHQQQMHTVSFDFPFLSYVKPLRREHAEMKPGHLVQCIFVTSVLRGKKNNCCESLKLCTKDIPCLSIICPEAENYKSISIPWFHTLLKTNLQKIVMKEDICKVAVSTTASTCSTG